MRAELVGIVIRSFLRSLSLFQFDSKNPGLIQEKQLVKILKKSKNTEFGRKYDFNEILCSKNIVKEFQKRIPVFDYETMHEKWWKHLRIKSNVCYPGKFKYFAKTSGTTTNKEKYIPVSSEMIGFVKKGNKRKILRLAYFDLPSKVFAKKVLYIGGSTSLEKRKGQFFGDLSGIVSSQVPKWFSYHFRPKRELTDKVDWREKIEDITLDAKNIDIGIIGGIPPWILMLLENIEAKVGKVQSVWPNLSLYVHGGVPFQPYEKQFKHYFKGHVKRMESYIASEGFIAFQKVEGRGMNLCLDLGVFFEFVEFSEEKISNNSNFLTLNEVKENVPYALVLTNCSGAYRYLLGDVIKFTDLDSLEIKYVGRTKQYLSVCAEHVTPENLDLAVSLAEKELGIVVLEFCVGKPVIDDVFVHRWFVSTNKKVDEKRLAESLDKHLRDINRDYNVKRQSILKKPVVKIVSMNSFRGWMESRGKLGGQAKFPKVLTDSQYKSFINHIVNAE